MSKRILFRLHGEHAQAIANECKVFIKDYFAIFDKRVRLSVVENNLYGLFYDLFINTANDETEHIAHAAGWSYIRGIETMRPLFVAGSTTAHNNPHLASALKQASIHFTK